MRYAVLGIGDRSYDEFCGHAKSLDRRLADLGATKLVDRDECEAYDDEPMTQWADRIVELARNPLHPARAPHRDAELGEGVHREPTRCECRCAATSC